MNDLWFFYIMMMVNGSRKWSLENGNGKERCGGGGCSGFVKVSAISDGDS